MTISMRCTHCPLSPGEACPAQDQPERYGVFCSWAAAGDPVHLRHIRAMAEGADPAPSAPEGQGPSLAAKALRFGRALVTHAVAGFPAADDALAAHRLATCRGCAMFDAERVECRSCGCHLDVKVRWAEQACPAGKW